MSVATSSAVVAVTPVKSIKKQVQVADKESPAKK